MRFEVEQEELVAGLQAVGRAVSSRTTLPVLTGILVEASGDALTLSGTDLEVTVRARVPAAPTREGAVVLPARYLSDYARRIPAGTIACEVDTGTQQATLRWQRSQYVIHGFAPEQFPNVAPPDGQRQVAFPQALLRSVVQQTAFAVSQDETRPTLTGVHLRIDADGLRAIATDGFRVAIRSAPFSADGGDIDAILPGRTLRELAHLLGDEEEVRVAFSDNQVHFDLGQVKIASRLIEGQYPNVLDLLPGEYGVHARVDRQELMAAADRASLLADSRLSTRLIVFNLEEGRIAITSQDPEVGQAYEEVPAEIDGEGFEIGLNARYLGDGLRQVATDEVWMDFIDPVKAVRVRPVDDEGYAYIVFPVRL